MFFLSLIPEPVYKCGIKLYENVEIMSLFCIFHAFIRGGYSMSIHDFFHLLCLE